MKVFQPWSKEQLKYLKNPTLSINDIAKLTGIHPSSVHRMRVHLGLNRKPYRIEEWSTDEILLLKNQALSNEKISQLTNRALHQVAVERQKRGYSRTSFLRHWTKEELQLLHDPGLSVRDLAILIDGVGKSSIAEKRKAEGLIGKEWTLKRKQAKKELTKS